MSSHITSDYNILAIVAGMRKHNMISYRDRYFMAGALRTVNEQITWGRWERGGNIPFNLEHQEVNWKLARRFSDEEIWESCKCWLYQVETDEGLSFDYITIIAGVRLLKETIEQAHLEDGTWKRKVYFGTPHFFSQSAEGGTWNDIDKQVEFDLAA